MLLVYVTFKFMILIIYNVWLGVAVVVLGICFCCIRRCFRKRRSKDGKKGMKGVDLKSVQLLGSAYKEKVQYTLLLHEPWRRKTNRKFRFFCLVLDELK